MIKKYLNTFLISFVILLIIIQYGLFAYFYYVKDFKSDNINQTQEVVETFKNDSNEKEKLSEFYVEIKGAVNSPGVFKVTSDNIINDQTTPNMIQRIIGIFERKPLISKEI